ncbi:sugar phosphate isomerase/epimerase family protein [Candidatus Undinarchaeota archaeon]
MILSLSHQALWNFSSSTFLNVSKDYFNGVELVDEPRLFSWELEDNLDAIKKRLSTMNLRVTLHAAYRDLNISSTMTPIRDMSVDLILKSIDKAKELNAEVITIHPGKMSGRKIDRSDAEMLMVESLEKICAYAEENNVKLALENMTPGHKKLCQTPEDILTIIDKVNSPALGACVDFSHVHLMKYQPEKFVEPLKDVLYNVHLSDSAIDEDHLYLGGGMIDVEEIFKILDDVGYTGSCVLEFWFPKDPLEGLLKSAQTVKDIFDKLERLEPKKPKVKSSAQK